MYHEFIEVTDDPRGCYVVEIQACLSPPPASGTALISDDGYPAVSWDGNDDRGQHGLQRLPGGRALTIPQGCQPRSARARIGYAGHRGFSRDVPGGYVV